MTRLRTISRRSSQQQTSAPYLQPVGLRQNFIRVFAEADAFVSPPQARQIARCRSVRLRRPIVLFFRICCSLCRRGRWDYPDPETSPVYLCHNIKAHFSPFENKCSSVLIACNGIIFSFDMHKNGCFGGFTQQGNIFAASLRHFRKRLLTIQRCHCPEIRQRVTALKHSRAVIRRT